MRVMGLEATAFDSPVIVTAEPSAAAKFASATIVTVIVLDCPARGLLWPIFFVVKDAALTVEHQKLDINSRIIIWKAMELLLLCRFDWDVNREIARSRNNISFVNKFNVVAASLDLPTLDLEEKEGENCAKALLLAGLGEGPADWWQHPWYSVKCNSSICGVLT